MTPKVLNFSLRGESMIITVEDRKTNEYSATLYHRLSRVIYKLHDRCNNKSHKEYKNYGGRGVSYDPKWSSVAGFIDDVDKIDGWNEEKFISHGLQLDKDIKYAGNKVYSKDTCMWVSRQENMQIQPSRQIPFYAINRETLEVYKGFSPTIFSKKYNLNRSVSYGVLKGKKHFSGDWKLWYITEDIPVITRIYAFSGNESVYSYTMQGLATLLGFPKGCFAPSKIANLDNYVYKGWTIKPISLNVQELINQYNQRSND